MLNILLAVVLIALFPFVIYALAKHDIFFTLLESGSIKFIMRGDSLFRIIHDIRGMKLRLNSNDELIEFVDGEEDRDWWEQRLGIYWIGWPPASRVHEFELLKESENPDGHTADDWTTGVEKINVTSLRHTFPLPFTLRDVELKDRTKVDLLVVGTFEIVRPYIPVFRLKGRFSVRANSRIRSATGDLLSKINNLTDFIEKPKGEEDGILVGLKDPTGNFNKGLIKYVGLRLTEVSIPQFGGDEAILAAANKEALALLEGKATIATANIYSQEVGIKTAADAARIESLGKARGEQIRETVAAMASTLGEKDLVTKGVTEVLVMEAATSPTSKLTTLVQGGNTPTVVPVGGNKQ